MIAIPLENSKSTTIADLYGNAPYFAMLNTTSGDFKVVENSGCGNGLDTAKCVKDSGATSTIFYHMGDGVFKFLDENDVKVYTVAKTYLSIDDIYKRFLKDDFKLVTKENSSVLLDSGTASCNCECND
jgi:predicted Fe-Mo cluster-binding NifX family protein